MARAQLPHWWALGAWWVRLLPERGRVQEQERVLVMAAAQELDWGPVRGRPLVLVLVLVLVLELVLVLALVLALVLER
jgi:hypothetical protein